MLKKIKKSTVLSLVLFTFLSSTGYTFADEKYIPKEGWYYTHSSKSGQVYNSEWKHEHWNGLGATDTVSYQVNRTQTSSGNLAASSNFSILQQSVGFQAEIGYQKSKGVTTSVNFSIPPYTKALLEYGSVMITGYGTEKYYENDVLLRSKSSNATYSFRPFSKSSPL